MYADIEENEEERRAAQKEFYRIYKQTQKGYNLRLHMHLDVYGNNFIEIWEYAGEKKRYVCKVKEETGTACYRRAVEMLKNYRGKDAVKNEKKAG